MKKVLLTTLFLTQFVIQAVAQNTYDAFDQAPLKEVLVYLESKHQIVFSYDDDRISSHFITTKEGSFSLQQVLQDIFNQTDLDFEFIDTKHIVLTVNKGVHQLKYLCGYVTDALTDEPVPFASIFNDTKSYGAESDQNGYFKISVSPTDRSIYISFLGYNRLEIPLQNLSTSPCLTYKLASQSVSFEPVILKEYLTDGINQTENANIVVIEPQEMDVLPGSVEKDVLATMQFLPGITSPGESLDGIHVRGGTPDQNLILWDGIPMYHTSHFFGTISAFNPNIIDHVNVHRSGIGSEFGGRVSSVIDIHSKEEITDNFNMGAGFNLTHAHLDFDIPLWKNSSLMISSRRSITDAWNTPTFVRYAEKVFQGTRVEENDFNSPDLQFSDEYKFNDANLKWMMDYGKNKFRFTSLGTLNTLNYKSNFDDLDFYSIEVLNLRNAGAIFSWERQWNERYSSKLDLTNAEYKYDYTFSFRSKFDNTKAPFSLDSRNSITDGGLNWNNKYVLNEDQNVNFGYQYTENRTSLDITQINRKDTASSNQVLQNRLHALYGEYSFRLPKSLQIEVGLRYLYQDILKNNYFEPRISMVSHISENLKLKISTGKHFQFVSQLVGFDTNFLGLNNEIWVTATNKLENTNGFIPVIESNQWMGGIFFQKGSWTFDIEGYVKELAGITTLTSTFVELNEKPFSSGNSRIRGIDFLIKKRIKRYRSWLSYSLSRTKYEFPGISLDPIIASHDQTHVLKWVHMYKYKSFEFSLGLEYRSGLPATQAFLNNDSIVYGSPNTLRLKDYFRMDGSIIYNFTMKNEVNGFIGFSLQNMGNRINILGRNYLLDNSNEEDPLLLEINERGLRFTPNISVNFRLN
ncbi:MAG: TonB-dependent receptor [Saprospiraceae bacterium]|nr:TonB-dependent receptor [Saprospiraceae bacterium]